MSRHKHIIIIIAVTLLVSSVMGLSACQKKVVSEPKKKTAAEIALETAYEKQNLALVQSKNLTEFGKFSPSSEVLNPDGIYVPMYIQFAGYHKYTGKTLTYQQVLDYLSSKYESDGTIRIYNNGRHPEIADYVEWAWNHQETLNEYQTKLQQLYYGYSHENPDFKTIGLTHWSIATTDELIKKEADPNYQLNLLAIQQQEATQSSSGATP